MALYVPLILCLPTMAGAWGILGHKYANGLAVDNLPAELKAQALQDPDLKPLWAEIQSM